MLAVKISQTRDMILQLDVCNLLKFKNVLSGQFSLFTDVQHIGQPEHKQHMMFTFSTFDSDFMTKCFYFILLFYIFILGSF